MTKTTIALAWAFVALAVSFAAVTFSIAGHGPSVGETSCTKVIYNYLEQASQAVGVSLAHEHLIACHQDGYGAVARVEFDATMTTGSTLHEVLAVRLTKSPWSIADVHLVG